MAVENGESSSKMGEGIGATAPISRQSLLLLGWGYWYFSRRGRIKL